MKFKHYVSLTKLSAAIIYEKAIQLASTSGVLLKDYISDPENIRHMSLILYDLLPLSIKITLRHETFYKYLTSLIKKMQEPLVIEEPKHTDSVLTNEYPAILKGKKIEPRPLPADFDMTIHQNLMKEVAEGKRVIKATTPERYSQLIKEAQERQANKKPTRKKKTVTVQMLTEKEDAEVTAAAMADPDSIPFTNEELKKVKITKRPKVKVIVKEAKE